MDEHHPKTPLFYENGTLWLWHTKSHGSHGPFIGWLNMFTQMDGFVLQNEEFSGCIGAPVWICTCCTHLRPMILAYFAHMDVLEHRFFPFFFDTRWLWPWIVGKMMIHHGMLWVHVHHVPDVLENWEWSADGQSIHGQFYVFFCFNGTNSWLHHKMGSHIYNL
jgi:hypothetical protein